MSRIGLSAHPIHELFSMPVYRPLGIFKLVRVLAFILLASSFVCFIVWNIKKQIIIFDKFCLIVFCAHRKIIPQFRRYT